ncbi:MAG: hypothetical protein RLY67_39 [Pseudomonadota bacterium]|jgi:MFS family permease
MTLYNKRDLLASLMFVGFGLLFLIYAQDYNMGTTRRMGPAFFPTILAILQIGLGLFIGILAFARSNTDDEPIHATDWRGLGLIVGSVFLFAQLLPVAGFVIAAPLLILLGSLASPESSWRERILMALILTVGCILVFRIGLEMRFPIWPPSLS